MKVGIVIIGRNEGQRLIDCLASLPKSLPVVYVDSNSTDSSVAEAKKAGAVVEQLDMTLPFTAARARNQGWKALLKKHAELDYIQFLDGDCQLDSGWLDVVFSFLEQNPQYAIACGRRCERYPQASLYNYICDIEWNTPIGDARSCGGDAMIRTSILDAVQGYRESLIAGEEPEMCVRIRQAGYKIRRVEQDMTWHDADMHRLSQWWRRSVRCGFAYANGAALHGGKPERHYFKETVRALLWGLFLPAIFLGLSLFSYLFLFLFFMVYLLQILRLFLGMKDKTWALSRSILLVLSKFSETVGILRFFRAVASKQSAKIIEYK